MTDAPQLYLSIAPNVGEGLADELAALIAAHTPACIRIETAGLGEAAVRHRADLVRKIAHAADIAVLLESHFRLVPPLGLDGVHLPDAHRSLRAARKALGPDAVIGCFCGASRHSAITAAEMGADYVAVGPFAPTPLGSGSLADTALVAWWAEMIETPLVVQGGIDPATAQALAPHADFIALGTEIWASGTTGLASYDALFGPSASF
ncbi:MAG: thiamine phosphate synthase [Pseudomonadota bacterium]